MLKNIETSKLSFLGLFFCFLLPAHVAGLPANITSFDPKVATLYQTQSGVNQVLSTITCIDPEGKPTKTYVKSVSPSSPCANCFEVVIMSMMVDTLQYRAGVGALNFASTPYYLVTVACDDGIEPAHTEVIQIDVVPNTPPYFKPEGEKAITVPLSGKAAVGTTITSIVCGDNEGDSLTYSMTVVPATSSGNYYIDPVSGTITTLVDMRYECRNDVTFLAYCSDGISTTGPLVVSAPISNPNVAPTCSNLDTTLEVPENSIKGTVYTMSCRDGNNDAPLTYTYTTNNAAGAAQFLVDGKSFNIDVNAALDYENAPLRQTNAVFTVTDGFCPSTPYSLKLQVTDVNERPTLTPLDSTIQECEGKESFDTGIQVSDPDNPDTVTWSFTTATANKDGAFNINPQTGAIIPLIDYDVDVGRPSRSSPMQSPRVFKIQVTDKGELTATATLTVSILECNDNAPIFTPITTYELTTTECITGGARIGSVKATDGDKNAPNNVLYYMGSGGAVQAGTGGEIIVSQALPAGSVVTFQVYAYDRGQNPGPLRSVLPAIVSVYFTPCPTTPPPTAAPPATTTTTTTTTTTKPTTTKKTTTKINADPNLPWIIIAALLGALMLGLLSYMLWRYGSLCVDACGNIDCAKSCRGKPATRTIKVRER